LSDSFFFQRFRAFGPLRYARITLDPATGRSRGTGFACFWNLEDADKVVQQSDILRAETTGHSTVVRPASLSLSLLPFSEAFYYSVQEKSLFSAVHLNPRSIF
jgi:RNA recognition motif-containing protein